MPSSCSLFVFGLTAWMARPAGLRTRWEGLGPSHPAHHLNICISSYLRDAPVPGFACCADAVACGRITESTPRHRSPLGTARTAASRPPCYFVPSLANLRADCQGQVIPNRAYMFKWVPITVPAGHCQKQAPRSSQVAANIREWSRPDLEWTHGRWKRSNTKNFKFSNHGSKPQCCATADRYFT